MPGEAEPGSAEEQLGKEYPGLPDRVALRSSSEPPKVHRAPGGHPAGGDFLKAPLGIGAMPQKTSRRSRCISNHLRGTTHSSDEPPYFPEEPEIAGVLVEPGR